MTKETKEIYISKTHNSTSLKEEILKKFLTQETCSHLNYNFNELETVIKDSRCINHT